MIKISNKNNGLKYRELITPIFNSVENHYHLLFEY
jgi:hypothetical protein